MFYWVMKRIFLGPVLKLLFRPWVKGLDNIPAEGAAIIASNHLSFSDSIFMPLMVRRPVVFLAKSEYFTGTGIKGRLTALFFRLTNQLPMDRSGGAASAVSLSAGMDVLTHGGLLGIYPEGTRSPDAKLYRGKVGVARLALQAGVPVIPVAMIGTDKVQPIGKRLPNIRRIGMIFGEPLDFSQLPGPGRGPWHPADGHGRIMFELHAALGAGIRGRVRCRGEAAPRRQARRACRLSGATGVAAGWRRLRRGAGGTLIGCPEDGCPGAAHPL